MEWVEKKGVIRRYPWLPAPMQLLLCGVFLTFATPMCCALFPQTYPISLEKLESDIQVNVNYSYRLRIFIIYQDGYIILNDYIYKKKK